MSVLLKNTILEAAEQKNEAGLTPQNKADYMKIVVAGMKMAVKMHTGDYSRLKASKDPIRDCAAAAINLCMLMKRAAKGIMPPKAMIPAAFTLMLQALDFCDKGGIIKVDNDALVKATHDFTNLMFQKFRITPQMLGAGIKNVRAITEDPAKMRLIHLQSGAIKHPLAQAVPPAPNEPPAGGDNGAD